MPFGLLSGFSSLFSGKWAIVGTVIAVLVAVTFYYRSETIRLEGELDDAQRENARLEELIATMKFMTDLDEALLDDLRRQRQGMDEQREQERQDTDVDINALRERITKQVRKELQEQRSQQTQSSSTTETETNTQTNNQSASSEGYPARQPPSEPTCPATDTDEKDYERLYKTLIRVNDAASQRVVDGMYTTYCRITDHRDCPPRSPIKESGDSSSTESTADTTK